MNDEKWVLALHNIRTQKNSLENFSILDFILELFIYLFIYIFFFSDAALTCWL